jgi:PAS domain S-box-containing protein
LLQFQHQRPSFSTSWALKGRISGGQSGLQETEDQFRVLAETLPQLVWTARPDGYHDYFNRRWYEFTGLPRDEPVGSGWSGVVHEEDRSRARQRWNEALASGDLYDVEYRLRGKDGTYRWFLCRALPIRGPSGEIRRWFGTCTDIEAQKQAEEALRRLDEQHRLALEAAELGTWDYSPLTGLISWDERSCSLFGIATADLRSLPFEEALARMHPDDAPRVRDGVAAALDPASDGHFEAEYRILPANGGLRWLHARGQTFFAGERPTRRAIRLSGVISDVTRRRNSEEAQQLLTRELNHRVKNLFAIASGMVSMTARTAKSTKDMAEALRGRLGALSRAHELVRPVTAPSHPPGQATDLSQLVRAILAPYAPIETQNRLQVEGEPVPVGANTTTSLALVLHELATNAAKYGCLSTPDGRLAIRWQVCSETVHLTWSESGGPAVGEAPSLEGFGSQLADKSITGQLGGTLVREWRSEGLLVTMTLALDRLAH